MQKIRWGILSTAKIGMEKVIPAIQQCLHAEVVAIASRSAQGAESAAAKLNIPGFYSSYEAMLYDPEIDAVYNPLPNHLHAKWSIEALKAGKHVLCEKPFAMDFDEAKEFLLAASEYPHLKLMEAFMYRFHPQWETTKALIAQDRIGAIQSIHADFSYFNRDRENIRNIAEFGGGALMDIGCYCISIARYLSEKEPQRVVASILRDPDFGTDIHTSGILDFGGITSTFSCSTQSFRSQAVIIYGTMGKITLSVPYTPAPDEEIIIQLETVQGREKIAISPANHYTLQGDAFSLAILENRDVPTPLSDALANMKVIDGLRESAEKSSWVTL